MVSASLIGMLGEGPGLGLVDVDDPGSSSVLLSIEIFLTKSTTTKKKDAKRSERALLFEAAEIGGPGSSENCLLLPSAAPFGRFCLSSFEGVAEGG